MIAWVVTAGGCAALVWSGLPWARALAGSRPGRWPLYGLGYLTGTALVTLGLLLVSLAGLPIGRLTLALVWIGVRLTGRRFADRTPPAAAPVPGPIAPALPLLALTAATLTFGLVQALRLGPIEAVDFLKAWGLKGTAMFHDGNLQFEGLSGPNLFYPLQVSNLTGAFYVLLGRVDDSVVRLPAALFGVSLALVLWWLARELLPPAGAALAVALAVATPQFTVLMTDGLADLVLAAYVTLCALAAYRWLEDGGDGWASLSGFAAGAAAWTKLEGALSCLVILAAVLLVRRSLRTPGLGVWLAWLAVFTLPWQLYQRIHGIPLNRSHFATLYLDLPWVVRHVSQTLAETAHWGVFWPLTLGLVALTAPFWWPTRYRLLAAVTLPNLVLTLGAYMTHYRAGEADSVEATAHRLYLHVAPGVAVLAAVGATLALGVLRAGRESHADPESESLSNPV